MMHAWLSEERRRPMSAYPRWVVFTIWIVMAVVVIWAMWMEAQPRPIDLNACPPGSEACQAPPR